MWELVEDGWMSGMGRGLRLKKVGFDVGSYMAAGPC